MSYSFLGGMQDNSNIMNNSASMAMSVGQMTGYNPYAMVIAGAVGGVTGGFANMAQYKQQYSVYTQQANTVEAQIAQLQLQNEQIDDYLDNYTSYYDQQMGQQYLQGRQQYSQAAGALSDSLVSNAAAGHIGGSSGIAAQQAESDLKYLYGNDMSMGGSDGLYGQAVAQLKSDLSNERKYSSMARDMNLDTIGDLSSVASNYRSKASEAKANSKDYGKQILSALTGGLFG